MTIYIPEREKARRAPSGATVAIAHDYLTQRGGAERVVLSIAKAFPGAMIHTSLFEPAETFPEFADLPIRTTALDHIDPFRRNHRVALPLLARSFSRMKVAADVVVCSSSGWAHGINTEGRKIIYCHNPARWLYQSDVYRPAGTGIGGMALSVLNRSLRRWDHKAAHGAHRYLANSTIVRDRIRDTYGLDAEVLPPPVTLDIAGPREPIAALEPGFVLCVSRLISYKNVEAVVAAMHGLPGQRLVIAGSGPDYESLQAAAPPNVVLVGLVSDNQLRWLYANCAGVVSASYEDFGLVPIEAASFGKPAALLRWGGFLDTLAEGTSGLFFDEPTPVAIGEALQALLKEPWRESDICEHAERFSEARFVRRIQEIAREEVALGGVIDLTESSSDPLVAPVEPAPTVVAPPLVAAPHGANRGAPVVTSLRGFATKAAITLADLASVSLAMLISFAVWSWWRTDDPGTYRNAHLWLGLLSLPVWLGSLANAGLYRSRIVTSRMEEMRRLARAATMTVFGIAAISAVTRIEAARLWLVLSFVFGTGLLTVERSIIRHAFRRQRLKGRRLRSIVVVGTNDEAVQLAQLLHRDRALGYQVVGFVSDDHKLGTPVAGVGKVLGRIDQTLSAVRRTNSTGVLIATTAVTHDASTKLARELSNLGVHVELSSSLRDVAIRRMTVRPVGRYPIVYVEPTSRSGWQGCAKRAFDILIAATGLIAAFPVLALAAVLIKIDSPGPVLFRQRRVGRGGSPFELVKLRTMVPDAEKHLEQLLDRNEASWPLFKMRRDPRVTRVGRLLRRSSIDELPQLWNVLRGRMSIVGPRPALASEMTRWTPDMHTRLRVRPGITGMWQVNGRSTSSAEDNERLDLYYVDNWSLWTDLAIIGRTVPAVIATKGAY